MPGIAATAPTGGAATGATGGTGLTSLSTALLVSGVAPSPATALSIFQHLHTRLAPFKRIRRIELVAELPKTISGKIRRVQLRRLEHDNDRDDPLRGQEFREEEFPELQKLRSAGSPES